MRKRVRLLLAVVLAAVIGVIAWRVLRQSEPVYEGRRLSAWLGACSKLPLDWQNSLMHPSDSLFNPEFGPVLSAKAAVRQAGTNALPTLLRMLRAKDSALKDRLTDLAKRQHLIKIEWLRAEDSNRAALIGFAELGATAQTAVPALIEIGNQGIPHTSQCCAIGALGFIGPSAKQAVPTLLRLVTISDDEVRYDAILALGAIHAEQDAVLPVLINDLHDSPVNIQHGALWALESFGPDAKRSVPALVELLDAHDLVMRWLTTNALKKIDPEAAARAGVK